MNRHCLLIAALCSLPGVAFGARTDPVDPWSRLQQARIQRLGAADALSHSNAGFIARMLADPGSPYSEPNPAPDVTNEVDWVDAVRDLGDGTLGMDDALAILQWDLGLGKARPGVDVQPVPGYRDPFVAVEARKADVDADIFWQALDLAGNRYSTQAAVYAVGLQILRRQMAEHPAERHRELGIDSAVFRRIMSTRGLSNARPYDLRYLSMLVQAPLIRWRPGGAASTGIRELPVAYRIARVAAAYRDTQGYVSGGPCLPDGLPRPGVAGTDTPGDNRPLCFVAATDRAVLRWYRKEHALQAAGFLPNQHTHDGLARFLFYAGAVLALLDAGALVEGVEAMIADDLLEAEAIGDADAELASERFDRLSCRPME